MSTNRMDRPKTSVYALHLPKEVKDDLYSWAEQVNIKVARLLRLYVGLGLFVHKYLSGQMEETGEPLEGLLSRYLKRGLYIDKVLEDPTTRLVVERQNGKEVDREVIVL